MLTSTTTKLSLTFEEQKPVATNKWLFKSFKLKKFKLFLLGRNPDPYSDFGLDPDS